MAEAYIVAAECTAATGRGGIQWQGEGDGIARLALMERP